MTLYLPSRGNHKISSTESLTLIKSRTRHLLVLYNVSSNPKPSIISVNAFCTLSRFRFGRFRPTTRSRFVLRLRWRILATLLDSKRGPQVFQEIGTWSNDMNTDRLTRGALETL